MFRMGKSTVRFTLAAVSLSLVTLVGGATSSGAVAAASQIAPAVAAPAVQVVGQRAYLGKGGMVAVRFKSRCAAKFQAFEMNVSVAQGAVWGSVFKIGPPNVQVCDGLWHTTVVKVAPETGTFHKGLADVEVSVQNYDTVQGNDTSAGAGKQVRLYR